MSNQVEGFALTGIEVKGSKAKTFVILQVPEYQEYQDGDQAKRKLKMLIEFNGSQVEYYPNKTSQAKIIAEKGRCLDNWIGYKGEFETVEQMIGKEKKEVIYIK